MLVGGGRAGLIDRLVRDFLDPELVRARRKEYEQATSFVRLLSILMFLHLFAVCPITAVRIGLAATWPILLLVLVTLMAVTAIAWRRAHARRLNVHANDRVASCVEADARSDDAWLAQERRIVALLHFDRARQTRRLLRGEIWRRSEQG